MTWNLSIIFDLIFSFAHFWSLKKHSRSPWSLISVYTMKPCRFPRQTTLLHMLCLALTLHPLWWTSPLCPVYTRSYFQAQLMHSVFYGGFLNNHLNYKVKLITPSSMLLSKAWSASFPWTDKNHMNSIKKVLVTKLEHVHLQK